MMYRIFLKDNHFAIFRHSPSINKDGSIESHGPRYMYGDWRGNLDIHEEAVYGLMHTSTPIANRAMFKLAVLNNFLDKLKEMCSTDLNTKQ